MSNWLYLVHVLQRLVFQLWTAVIVINQALCSLATGCFINESASHLHFFTISHQISSRSCLHQILSAAHFYNIIQFGIPDSAPVPQTRTSVYWITTRSWNKRKMKTWKLSTKCKEKPLISKWYHPSRLRTGYGQTIFSKSFLYVCVCTCVYV